MSDAFTHNLGDKVRDKLSGLVGIVTARAEHLYGCARYWVTPQEVKDGKPVEGCWLDEDQLEVLESRVIQARQYRVVEEVSAELPSLRLAGGPISQPASHVRHTTK